MPKSSKNSLKMLVRKALSGDRRAIAQLMSKAENDPYSRMDILSMLYWSGGKAWIIGVTGPPGCGKSTLIAQLAKNYTARGQTVGVVAVDPSSHITGGALLGDRIRMTDLAGEEKLFIRSMATRGHVGGIARATEDAVKIFDASGMNYVIVETAGAGQSDVDVKKLVHTTLVVTAPGLGDEIQAAKAGLMEIGDIFVINKADKETADRAAQEIHSMVMISEPSNGWRPPVLKTVATTGEGITGLIEAINQHMECFKRSAMANISDSDRIRSKILEAAKEYFEDVELKQISASERFHNVVEQVKARKVDPYTAGRKLVTRNRHL